MAAAKAAVDISDFEGVQLQESIQDSQPGKAQDQVNIRSDITGLARVRLGMLPVSFVLTTS